MKCPITFPSAVTATAALFFFCHVFCHAIRGASRQIAADPNLIAMGGEYCGTLQLKAGDRLTFRWFDIGGFVEVRNEPQFNKGLFPNHNWRGFLSGTFAYPLIRQMQSTLSLFTGLEHESSHATMGIVEQTRDPYGMIYDHAYRKSVMSGLPAGVELFMYDEMQQLVVSVCGTWYFLSKNTPELPGLAVANSGGITLGGEYRYQSGRRLAFFGSIHERFVFRGPEQSNESIFIAGGNVPVAQRRAYPIINRVNTFTVMGGISLQLFEVRRVLDIYVRYLYGNIYGYVDSRDKRSIIAVGLTVRGR